MPQYEVTSNPLEV